MSINNPTIYSYQSELIPLLKAEHQEILNDCDLILRFIKDRNLKELNRTLLQFSNLIGEHLEHEERLYIDLNLKDKHSNIYKEMRTIGREIHSTLSLYTNGSVRKYNLDLFRDDFISLNKSLFYRMKYEERYLFTEYEQNLSKAILISSCCDTH